MADRLGISVLDLLPQTSGLAVQAPDAVIEKIGVLTILDHRSTVSQDFVLHEGVLQSALEVLGIDTSSWAVKIPGLTLGLPFRLAIQRGAPAGSGAEEPAPTLWTLDIEVWDVEVQIPGVQAAAKSGGDGVTPLTLIATGTTDEDKKVFLVGRGVVRIAGGGSAGTSVQIVDSPDPLDPTAPTGSVIRLTVQPPSFLFGQSKYGMTLDEFVLDFSKTYTPSEIAARGHDEAWEGVAFREASFYFPPDTPFVHSLSLSTRDVIIGDPGGLQGELAVEFGQDLADVYNTRIAVRRQDGQNEVDVPRSSPASDEPAVVFAVPAGPNGTAQRVKAVFSVGAGELIPGHTDLAVVGVYWKLPDGTEGTGGETPWFDAPTDKPLVYRLREGAPSTATNTAAPASKVPDGQTELAEVKVTFPRDSGGPSGVAPLVDCTVGTTVYTNVIHLRGPRTRLKGISLAVRGGGKADWTLTPGSYAAGANDTSTVTLPLLPEDVTRGYLTAQTKDGTRRILIEATRQGPLALGHQKDTGASSKSMVTVDGTGDASPTSVKATFLATPFHLAKERKPAKDPATISGTEVTVPQGADAEVEVPLPSGADDPVPAPVIPVGTTSSVVQVLYDFGKSVPVNVVYPYTGSDPADAVAHEPDALPLAQHLEARLRPEGGDPVAQLMTWLAALGPPNGRKFFVVGRTDDLWSSGNLAENKTANDGLADARAAAAAAALVSAGVPAGDVTSRHESVAWGSAPPGFPPARITDVGRLALPAGLETTPSGASSPVWNRRWNPDAASGNTHNLAVNDPHRPPYRCAEIYAVDTGSVTPPPPPPGTQEGVPTRMLVPGPDGDPAPGQKSTSDSSPPVDYRVKLDVKWDSPTVVSAADAIPTEAQALVAWKKAQVELPATSSGSATTVPPPTGPDYWQVLLQWAYDARSGETQATGALSLPDGTLTWESNALAGALAFGPAFTALLDPSDTVKDPMGEFVAAAAMVAVGAAIGELINSSGPESTVDIDKFAVSYKWNGAAQVGAKVDYTIDLRVNVSISGAGSLTGHLKLQYKGVGLRFDGKPGGGLAGVALTYDDLSVEVKDPGTWSLGGPLGNLIRIAASRIGNGSQWMEFDLAFALDLGVITLEGATVRLGISPFSIELRGLTASVDIPQTLKGKGSVTIGDGGAFRALLALEVIPAKLSAYGSLAVDQDFVAVEVGVQLPVGIPLANTGFGIFGFMGRFVANGTRNLDGLVNPDPVQKQLDWYVRSPEQKYKRLSGQFAFGVGAVVGTLPDSAFTFNAEGSLTVGFPDVSVIFGIDAHLLTQRKSQATESGTASSASFRILGMVLIDESSIMIAVRGSYEIPKVLKLTIPISAYFPLAGTDTWYIRIGTDNEPATTDHPARPGSPVTITLLPDLLDVTAWAFTMIEERQLHHLGGALVPLDLADPLDFDGFCIGVGAGFDLKYSAGPFKLEITAFLLVGVGTKPLLFAGAAGVKGELDLVVVSVGVDGLVHFHVSPDYSYVQGHFCGHVDCFFFEVSGCVDIRIGDDPPLEIPEPEPPFAGLDLCDHLAVVKGKASGSDAEAAPTVWPDTVAVLKCKHYVEDGLGGGADFDRKVTEPAALSPWTGSTELKYAYRLKSLSLHKLTGSDPNDSGAWTQVSGPFDSAWWLPTHRIAVIEGGDSTGPSTEEGRELGLFSWDPRAWSRWLGEGSQDLPGDPATTVGEICDPVKPADPSCAFGKDWTYAAGRLGSFLATPATGSAFPSRFSVFAELPAGLDQNLLAALGADAGWNWYPGAVVPLHGGLNLHGTPVTSGWRLPEWRAQGQVVATAPLELALSRPLLQGELVLEVCPGRQVTPPPRAQCDTAPQKDTRFQLFVGEVSKTNYTAPLMTAFTTGQGWALRLLSGPLAGAYPGTVGRVSVEIDPEGATATLVAYDAQGAVVGQVTTSGPGRQSLTVTGSGIARIAVAGDKQPAIFEICWGGDPGLGILSLLDLKDSSAPVVVAFDVKGNATVLTGAAPQVPPPSPAAAIIVRCPKLVYTLPPGPGWTRIAIAPWLRGEVSLVACCGVTLEAAQAQADDSEFRDSLKGLLLDLAQYAVTNQPTHKVYLDAQATYEIRAEWQYQGFRPANQGDQPPSTGSGTWTDATAAEHFRFATAAYGLAATPAPAESTSLDQDPAQGGPGYDERTFDPRGIARYLTRATPTHEDPPQFLDDPVGFWFSVDHLEPLVEKYDRILQAKVLHTTPSVGSLHAVPAPESGSKHPLDVTKSTTWKVETTSWFAADRRLVEATEAAPCLGQPPALGSSSVSVEADLEPRQEYDLLLNVAPKTVGAYPEVVTVRSHFRTSSYRNPSELLAALGFADPLALGAPTDVVGTAPLAAGALEIGDTALDAALSTLGLDPWPLPAAPRTTAVWLPPAGAGQPWQLAAVLLESDEPIWRAGFTTGAIGEPVPPPRLEVANLQLFRTYEKTVILPFPFPHKVKQTVRTALGSLTERVRSGGATRSIFVPTSPIAVSGGRLYDLELLFSERGVAGTHGRAPLFDRPLMVLEEGE